MEEKQITTFKSVMSNNAIKKRFDEILGKKAQGFISSIINLVNSDTNLSKCDPNSILGAAIVAASLDLPVDKNLGFTWVIPYGTKAQFQIGYKGLVQLALRTGQYSKINVIPVYEGQLIEFNPLTEKIEFDFNNKLSDKVIGIACYFELINGFSKTEYWDIEEVSVHAKKYSKTFTRGPWQDEFIKMSKKTVLKNVLSKWGILSVEMQSAIKHDQATIIDDNVDYPDFEIKPEIEENAKAKIKGDEN